MKITKTKEVETITEEIEILEGIYYFSYGYKNEDPYEYYKIEIYNESFSELLTNIITTKIRNSYQDYLISQREDFTDYLGANVEHYFKKEWLLNEYEIKEITEDIFEKQKQEVKEKL